MKAFIIALMCSIIFFPANVFATDYFYHNNQLIIKEKRVEFDHRNFFGLDGYYSLGHELRENYDTGIEDELLKTKAQLELALKLLQECNKNTNPDSPNNPNQPDNPTPDVPDDKYTELDKKVYTIFRESCVDCHGINPTNNSLSLITPDGLNDISLVDRLEIHDRTFGVGLAERGKAKMPKGNKTLSDEQVETIRLWALEGAKKE